MPEHTQDIEIYLKRVGISDIIAWLETIFLIVDQASPGSNMQSQLTLEYNQCRFHCNLFEKAVKGSYTSLWFTEDHTPWACDRDCGLAAFRQFNCEVRYANGGWDGDENESGGWIRLTKDGESIVNWRT